MSALERHEKRIRALGCMVCRRVHGVMTPAALHHVAEGSGLRSPWAQVPLCAEHHQGGTGFHAGPKQFLGQFRPPGDQEWGMLIWLIEDMARAE